MRSGYLDESRLWRYSKNRWLKINLFNIVTSYTLVAGIIVSELAVS